MKSRDSLIVRLKSASPVRALAKRMVASMDAEERASKKARLRPQGTWSLSPLVALLPESEIAALHARGTMHAYARRAVTVLDEADERTWIVVEGGVKLCRVGALGNRVVEAMLEPGAVFGRVSRGAERATYEVQTLEAAKILSVPRAVFESVLQRNPELAFSVVQELEDRQRRLVRRIEALVFKDVRARVAETLLDLARSHAEPCAHGFAVDVRVNQQDLAELVGASRQMVNRVLGELSRALVVQRMGRVICVLDRPRLERVAAELVAPA